MEMHPRHFSKAAYRYNDMALLTRVTVASSWFATELHNGKCMAWLKR